MNSILNKNKQTGSNIWNVYNNGNFTKREIREIEPERSN